MWGLSLMPLTQKNVEPVFKVLRPCENGPPFFMKIATSKILNIERTEIISRIYIKRYQKKILRRLLFITKLEKITYNKVIATMLCNFDHHFLNDFFHNKK